MKTDLWKAVVAPACLTIFMGLGLADAMADSGHSVARQWNEELLQAIRGDFARPTVHARNLYHTSVAMWDAWAAFDRSADGVIYSKFAWSANIQAAREEAISFAAYRLLSWRFANSPGAEETLPSLDMKMDELGYDRAFTSTEGVSPAALGSAGPLPIRAPSSCRDGRLAASSRGTWSRLGYGSEAVLSVVVAGDGAGVVRASEK